MADEQPAAKKLLTGKHPKSHGDATVAMDADDPRWNNRSESAAANQGERRSV